VFWVKAFVSLGNLFWEGGGGSVQDDPQELRISSVSLAQIFEKKKKQFTTGCDR